MVTRTFEPREDWVIYFNDFLTFNTADWTITTVEAGAGDATEALGDAAGGVLVVTNDAADNDSDFFQLTSEPFKFVSGKRTLFKTRFKVSDATDSDLVFGLQITDTTPLAVTDGVYFQKDDGDAYLDFHVTKDSTSTNVTAAATLSDDTYVVAEFYYDGDAFAVYVDGEYVGSAVDTNMPDDEELTVSFGVQNGEAVAKVLTVDYIYVAQER